MAGLWRQAVCAAAAAGVFLTVTGSCEHAHAAEAGNLILNRPYSYYPEPSYPHCKDEDDLTHLTDGKTFYAGGMWMFSTTVGWSVAVGEPVVFLFELQEEATLSELRFNTCGGGAAGVVEVGLQVYGSLDNEHYISVGELPAPVPPSADKRQRIGAQLSVSIDRARAKYVAVVATPPEPFSYVFVDEIELYGKTPADPRTGLPAQPGIQGNSAEKLHARLSGRSAPSVFPDDMRLQTSSWPGQQASEALADADAFSSLATKTSGEELEAMRQAFIQRHRARAKLVYDADTLVWETVPDEKFVPLSLPVTRRPEQEASVHTVVNALEAAALGVANLTENTQTLVVSVSGAADGAPAVTPRVARFFRTENAFYVPDALLNADSPQSIPSGESRLVWIAVESTGAVLGAYKYDVTLQLGKSRHNIPLDVTVHEVTLPGETPLTTGNWAYLDSGNNGDPVYEEVREQMRAYRITVGACTSHMGVNPRRNEQGNIVRPVEMDFRVLDQFLEFNREFPVISFFWPFHASHDNPAPAFGEPWMSNEFREVFKEWLVALVGRIKSSGRGYDDFHLQMFDETLDNKVAELCALAKEADPDVRIMSTFYQDPSLAFTQHFVDAGMDIFIWHAPRLGYDLIPDWQEAFSVFSSGGREFWFYHAAAAGYGIGRERDPLDVYRLLHWLAFRHGATGVYFWNMLHNATSGWQDGKPGERYYPMVYPIDKDNPPPRDVKTSEVVVPSRRWEYTRMGIEDYMLLRMARDSIAALEPAAQAGYTLRLDAIVKSVLMNLPRPTSYHDRQRFRRKRQDLVELVAELQ